MLLKSLLGTHRAQSFLPVDHGGTLALVVSCKFLNWLITSVNCFVISVRILDLITRSIHRLTLLWLLVIVLLLLCVVILLLVVHLVGVIRVELVIVAVIVVHSFKI